MDRKIFTFISFLMVGVSFILFVLFLSSDIDHTPYPSESKDDINKSVFIS